MRLNTKLSYKVQYQPFQNTMMHVVQNPYAETMNFLKSPT
jgi:hypothetical protein